MKTVVNLIYFYGLLVFLICPNKSNAQQEYRYSVDLTKVVNDRLNVELITPQITQQTVRFFLPKIVPGTYMNSNYGKYVHHLKAYDHRGKKLKTSRLDANTWLIKNANQLYRLTYQVEDTWDAKIKNSVYSMAGTNFEAGKNFVLNTPGLFGYFQGSRNMPFMLSFTKPNTFYAATGLKAVKATTYQDIFRCNDADELYDSPIMYCIPDTVSIKVGGAEVLIAVYSPNKKATAAFIAQHLRQFLQGANAYLGGKLPVSKYAFIFYFNGEQPKQPIEGAWEHSYSSFYSLQETPQNESIGDWINIAAHEFFHIVTPLNMSSREIREFNFNETILSKHLWLYEGSTEYYAYHMQVWAGIMSPEKFLQDLSKKINYSRTQMNDSLSFTELSKGSAGKYAAQYSNVYAKGALISACIDLYLLKLSNGKYGIRQLKQDLGNKYGPDKYFEDDTLFQVIADLTYPEMLPFFKKYVEGNTPLPYEDFLAMAGVEYKPSESCKEFTIGVDDFVESDKEYIWIDGQKKNEFGKQLGFQDNDVLYSINNELINKENVETITKNLFKTANEGDLLWVKVQRLNKKGKYELITLQAPMKRIEKTEKFIVRFMENPSAGQLMLRDAWLNKHTPNQGYIGRKSSNDQH